METISSGLKPSVAKTTLGWKNATSKEFLAPVPWPNMESGWRLSSQEPAGFSPTVKDGKQILRMSLEKKLLEDPKALQGYKNYLVRCKACAFILLFLLDTGDVR
jgi:hypothetical protein